jgi:hypothetical protein
MSVLRLAKYRDRGGKAGGRFLFAPPTPLARRRGRAQVGAASALVAANPAGLVGGWHSAGRRKLGGGKWSGKAPRDALRNRGSPSGELR